MLVRELVTRLGFEVDRSKLVQFDRNIGQLKNNLNDVTKNLERVADGMGRVGRTLSLFVSLPLAGVGFVSIKAAAQIEQVALSFDVMLGSAKKGKALLKDLFDFAKKTPFKIEEMGPTAKQLVAMGIESEKLIDTLTLLGNAAAGTGVPLQRLTYNFGQVKSNTIATAMDLRQFAMAGVPINAVLSEMIFGSEEFTDKIKKMTSQGKITFPLIEEAFQRMSAKGGIYHDLMKRMAEETLIGVWSNFIDGTFLARIELGKIIVSVLKLGKVLKRAVEIVDKAIERFKKMSDHTKKLIVFIGLFLIALGPLLMILSAVAKSIFFLHSALLILKAAFFTGAVASGAFNASMLILPIIIIAVAAALALLVEDISVWVRGGRSITGRLLGPWEEWRDNMTGFFEAVGAAIYNLVHGQFDELLRKGKLLAKTLGFLFQGIFGIDEAKAEKILGDIIEKQGSLGTRAAGRAAGGSINPNEYTTTPLGPDFTRLSGMANRPGGPVNITLNTEVVVPGGVGEATPQDIADTVNAVIQEKIEETIITNMGS